MFKSVLGKVFVATVVTLSLANCSSRYPASDDRGHGDFRNDRHDDGGRGGDRGGGGDWGRGGGGRDDGRGGRDDGRGGWDGGPQRRDIFVDCESHGGDSQTCPINDRRPGEFIVDVDVQDRKSDAPCIQNGDTSHGYYKWSDQDGITVKRGCRATFRVTLQRR